MREQVITVRCPGPTTVVSRVIFGVTVSARADFLGFTAAMGALRNFLLPVISLELCQGRSKCVITFKTLLWLMEILTLTITGINGKYLLISLILQRCLSYNGMGFGACSKFLKSHIPIGLQFGNFLSIF